MVDVANTPLPSSAARFAEAVSMISFPHSSDSVTKKLYNQELPELFQNPLCRKVSIAPEKVLGTKQMCE